MTGRPSFVRFTSLNDELNRLFGSQVSESWTPAIDVYADKASFVVQADGTLTISGERKAEQRSEETEVYRSERYVGRFQRALVLPTTVAADKVKAGYTDGVLTVTLPKTEEAKPRKIDVSVN